MKRKLFFILFVAILVFTYAQSVAHASVNDFSINKFHADYYLSKDSNNVSTLDITETIEAQFPSFDQNHGIERAIPKKYKGKSVDTNIVSIKNASVNPGIIALHHITIILYSELAMPINMFMALRHISSNIQ